ncbi:MAG: alkaline phosphatase family protein [candidate division WOR-3 bacterium]
MGKTNNRVVVIGLDGATWKILRPWLEEMPYLWSLQQGGASGTLLSTLPPITAPAWASFQTGVLPGKHGIYSFQQIERTHPGSWKLKLVDASSMRARPFWNYLEGQRVEIINLPMTYPPAPVPGFLVTGFPTPSRHASFTFPSELQRELLEAVPDYNVPTPPKAPGLDYRRAEEYIARVTQAVQACGQAALYLMRRYSWDLFIVQFQETDFLQHTLWHYLDSEHPCFSPQGAELAKKFFRSLDTQIAQIHHELSPNDVLWVISDHGFQAMRAAFYPNVWLKEHGWLIPDMLTQSAQRWAQLMRAIGLGAWLHSPVAERGRRLLRSREAQRSTAYAVAEHVGCFLLYLLTDKAVARQDELANALLHVKDPATGEKIVRAVLPARETFGEERAPGAPDLVVCLRKGYAALPNIENSQLIEPWAPERNFQVGIHDPEGIFIAYGSKITLRQEHLHARLLDIAPTVLALLGVPIPAHMDGRVLSEICRVERVPKVEQSKDPSNFRGPTDSKDSEEICRRLKDLGYL